MHRPVLITPPAIQPVSLAEAKLHLRVDHNDEDTLIESLTRAATEHSDGWNGILGRCLVEQVWRQDHDRFARQMIIPLGPVIAVQSITWRDLAPASATMGKRGQPGFGTFSRMRRHLCSSSSARAVIHSYDMTTSLFEPFKRRAGRSFVEALRSCPPPLRLHLGRGCRPRHPALRCHRPSRSERFHRKRGVRSPPCFMMDPRTG